MLTAAGAGRQRILFLTPQLPYPPEQGTAIRNYNLLRQVASRHEVALLSFDSREGDGLRDHASQVGPLSAFCRPLRVIPVPRRSPADRLSTLLTSSLPDMAFRLYAPAFVQALREIVSQERYDIVQIEGIELARYGLLLREWLGAAAPRVILDEHNAEYLLQRRAFERDLAHPGRWPAALYSLVQWFRLAHFERRACRAATAVAACSEADARALQALVPGLEVLVVPNGVDTERYQPGIPDSLPLQHPAIVFTGKMDFRPNVDGVLWFYERVWPTVRATVRDVRLYVVGQSPHQRLDPLRADPQVTITGYVPDILPYFGGADVYIVPLRIGGGTRLKVLEAMSSGLPIVSTTLGAEGIDLTPGQHALLADEPEAFARAVLLVLQDRDRAHLGLAASQRARELYDWRSIALRLEGLYQPS